MGPCGYHRKRQVTWSSCHLQRPQGPRDNLQSMTFPGTACRVLIVAGAAAAALASGSSNANRPADGPQGGGDGNSAPPSQPMEAGASLGLWKTNFGPVKIEKDPDSGESNLRGVWVYDRSGEEVVGYFSGPLDGNVLQFRWVEPA